MGYNKGLQQPNCVLICGKTDILEREALLQIAQYYNVVVADERIDPNIYSKKLSKKIKIYKEVPTSENFAKIFYAYSPEAVWYFSGFIDGGEGLDNERKIIERLIKNCVVNEVQKLIVVSSINSLNYRSGQVTDKNNGKLYASQVSFDCAKMEELVRFDAGKNMVRTVLLRVPFIYNKENRNNYLGSIFGNIEENNKVDFPYNEKQIIDFMSLRDVCELLISVTEETMDESNEYTILSGFDHTYGEFGQRIRSCEEEIQIDYDRPSIYELDYDKEKENNRIRENYGFIAADDVFLDIDRAYKEHKKNVSEKSFVKDTLKKMIGSISDNVLKISELLILFIFVQFLLGYTSDSVYFKFVDLRLFYVVIMGIAHGMHVGIVAGILECVSLVFAYGKTGVTGTMLFYNMDYWFPFVIYIMTGAITGYMTTTKNQKIAFTEEEMYALQDKYIFLNSVYMSVIDNKEDYKRQILGYQDSFGKIFDAVEKLDSSLPAEIFMNGIDTLEHILNNNSIAIYTMDENQEFLRMVACSRKMINKLTNSVSINDFKGIYDSISARETWKNTDFAEGLPMYAYAIAEDNNVRLMICLFDAGPEQMGLYYMNLFTILCHLIRVSFLRALDYQEAIEDEKYYEGTEVLIKEYFISELELQRKMADSGIAHYILLKIEADDIVRFYNSLKGIIRHSDLMGIGEEESFYLLLTQTTRDIFDIVGNRLKGHNIVFEVVEGI
ncbi:MAG: hypothetical protein K6E98_00110 [Lachnospiraceae bacterium]|nr:hypothetical protein [Lachnospiraceae bacterium]